MPPGKAMSLDVVCFFCHQDRCVVQGQMGLICMLWLHTDGLLQDRSISRLPQNYRYKVNET